MNIRSLYEKTGCDFDGCVRRLGSEAMVKKYFMLLPMDESFGELINAVSLEDKELTYRYAHMLRGVALNLGLTPLAASCKEIMNLLTATKVEYPSVRAALISLEAVYNSLLEGIRSLEVSETK